MNKRFLLSAALAATMSVAFAQNGNVVKNGDFEAEFEAYQPYSSDFEAAKSVPGWELETGGIYNGNVRILEQEPDGDIIADDNYQYMRIERKNDNGWANISAKQTIGVVPGTEYSLSFLGKNSVGTPAGWIDVLHQGIIIYDKQEGGEKLVDLEVTNPGWEEIDGGKFTPKNDKIVVVLYANNPNWNKVKNEDSYVEFDNVEINGDTSNGISSVENTAAKGKTAVFDLSGRKVNVSSEAALRDSGLKGVFIVKQGDLAKKIAVK